MITKNSTISTYLPHAGEVLAALLLVDMGLQDVTDQVGLLQELSPAVLPPAHQHPSLAGLLAGLLLDGAVRRIPASLGQHRVGVGGQARDGLQLRGDVGGVGVGRREGRYRLKLYLMLEGLLVRRRLMSVELLRRGVPGG